MAVVLLCLWQYEDDSGGYIVSGGCDGCCAAVFMAI